MVGERQRGLEGELGVLPRPIEISDLEGVCGELEARVHHAWGIPGLCELPERFLKVPRRVVHPRQRIPGRSRSGAAKARGAGRQSASFVELGEGSTSDWTLTWREMDRVRADFLTKVK